MGRIKLIIIYQALFLSFFVLGLWCIDVGVAGMIAGKGMITNGWWTRTPVQQYHIGLILTYVTMFANTILGGVLHKNN